MLTSPVHLRDEVIPCLVAAVHPREIYLFGSHAQANPGSPHRHSDLDLLVVMDDQADIDQADSRCREILSQWLIPFDVVVVHQSHKDRWSPVRFSLPYEATQKGDLLYAA